MKRITLIILAVAAILIGSVSCQKVNDIDKRLTELEQTVSKLKSQISAGAVITSVEKTADGCTFTLSNGQSYNVTNGTNGTNGEAIIADVKIEDEFVVLTLKNGDTLRITYQNPLSMVTLNIVPDYNDGTVREPQTVEAMEMKNVIFYLDVAVTPANYAEILSDTERFIHKAVFSPVQTKSGFGNAFTISPESVMYAEGAPVPFLEARFDLDDEAAAALENSAYTVSYSIDDKDGVHGTATAFVTISNNKGSGDVPSNNDIPDGALKGIFSVSGSKKVYFSKGNLWSDGGSTHILHFEDNQWSTTPFIATESKAVYIYNHVSHFLWTDTASDADRAGFKTVKNNFFAREDNPVTINGVPGWYALSYEQWNYLINTRTVNGGKGFNKTCVWKEVYGVNGLVIFPDDYPSALGTGATWDQMEEAGCVFLPAAGYRSNTISSTDVLFINSYGHYWSSTPYANATHNDYAYYLRFYNSNAKIPNDATRCGIAKSVRLVRNVD